MSWPSADAISDTSEYGAFTDLTNDMILRVIGAATLPSNIAMEASSDIYFKLVGSVLRHPRGTSSLATSEQFYVKVKALLNHGGEKDPLTRLKAVCLISLWHTKPPLDLNFDSGWYWIGVSVRQLFQMGLHRESSYQTLLHASTARRIAWSIYVSVT